MASNQRKAIVIGVDCAEPSLVFDQWLDELPAFKKLAHGGTWGRLQSSIPCITVPAWMSMMTSKDAGQLGFYGFRNRGDFSYKDLSFATSLIVREPTVWDILGKAGRRSTVIGVPPAYPPKPINGSLITCFLTPSTQNEFTYPSSLKPEIQALVGDYMFDVKDFRTDDKDYLLRQVYEMNQRKHKVVMHLLKRRDWDFFMSVEMGVDRMHHAFWRFMDPLHIKHEPGTPYQNAIKDYYKTVDEPEIAEMLAELDDNTVVLVVSDHGAKRMDGGFCLNEWLWRQGYLTLKTPPTSLTPFEKCAVDWTKTIAWGAGGYYGRLFLNVQMADSAWKGICILAAAIFVLALPIERWVLVFKGLSDGTVQGMATTINLMAEGTIIVVLVWLGLRAAYLRGVHYEINPDRIEWTRGLFSRKVDNIDMFRVIDIKLHRSILDCMTGVGTITLMTKDESDPQFVFEKVRQPRGVYDTIKRATLEADRRQGVVHIE